MITAGNNCSPALNLLCHLHKLANIYKQLNQNGDNIQTPNEDRFNNILLLDNNHCNSV